MKDIRGKLIELLGSGYCTPQISGLARKVKEPASTIHYNIKQLEKDTIRKYKAVFNYEKAEQGYCTYAMIHLLHDEYVDPSKIAIELSEYPQVECVDVVSGNWDIILRVRTNTVDEYYDFVKNVLGKKKLSRIQSVPSMKQIKDEFVKI